LVYFCEGEGGEVLYDWDTKLAVSTVNKHVDTLDQAIGLGNIHFWESLATQEAAVSAWKCAETYVPPSYAELKKAAETPSCSKCKHYESGDDTLGMCVSEEVPKWVATIPEPMRCKLSMVAGDDATECAAYEAR